MLPKPTAAFIAAEGLLIWFMNMRLSVSIENDIN